MKKIFSRYSTIAAAFLIGCALAFGIPAAARVYRGIEAALGTGDVKTQHILDGTLLDADISNSAAIKPQKLGRPVPPDFGGTGATSWSAGIIVTDGGTATFTSTSVLSYHRGGTGRASYTAGDILIGSSTGSVGVIPAGADGQYLVAGGAGVVPAWETVNTDTLAITVTAGEALTAGQAVAFTTATSVGPGDADTEAGQQGFSGNTWKAMVFTATRPYIYGFRLWIYQSSGAQTLSVSLRATDGTIPSGADLTGIPLTASVSAATPGAELYFAFVTSVPVTVGNHYAIVCRAGGTLIWSYSSNGYAGDAQADSTNAGASWTTDGAKDLTHFYVIEGFGGVGLHPTNATNNNEVANNFVGFVSANASSGALATVTITGISTSLAGLTLGSRYYLADVAGTIATTAGSQSRAVGLALDPARLLIRYEP